MRRASLTRPRELGRPIAASTVHPVRSAIFEGGAALAAYAILSVLLTWPLASQLGTTVIGHPASDLGGLATLWRFELEGGYGLFGTTEHTFTGAPLGWEEGNALNLQWLLPYYSAYLLTLLAGEVVAFNLTILSGLTLSGAAMYWLARRLGCSILVAVWAGLVFMFFPWLVTRVSVGHASMTHLATLPLLFVALHAWSRRHLWGRAALVGLATCASWLTSGYFGTMAVIGSLAFALAVSVIRFRVDGIRRAATDGAVLVSAVLMGTLLVGLASLPGRIEGGIVGERSVADLSIMGARPAEFLVPSSDNPVVGKLAAPLRPDTHGQHPAETKLYVGWLTIALALLWLGTLRRRRRLLSRDIVLTSAGLLTVLVVALALAAPSPIGIGGYLFTWTPSWLLFQILPEIRMPSRFVVLVMTALVPLAALGLELIVRRARSVSVTTWAGARWAFVVVALAIVVSVVELFPDPQGRTRADRLPELYRAVERTPRGVLAEYALVQQGADHQFWQRLHGRPLLNGARRGTPADDLRRGLVDPGSPGVAEALALLGVTAMVTRADALDYTDDVPDVPNADWGAGYRLVERFPDGSSVWRVVAQPAPAVAILRSPGFGDPNRPRGNFIGYPLRESSGELELRARAPRRVKLLFSVDAPRRAHGTLRIAGITGEKTVPIEGRTLVSLVVMIPRGVSRLSVSTRGSAPVELSAPRLTATGDQPVVTAERISESPGL